MSPTAGFIWIEGSEFHYIDETGAERYFTTDAYDLDTFPYTFPFWFYGS